MALIDAVETGKLVRDRVLDVKGEIVAVKLSVVLCQFDVNVVTVEIECSSF